MGPKERKEDGFQCKLCRLLSGIVTNGICHPEPLCVLWGRNFQGGFCEGD